MTDTEDHDFQRGYTRALDNIGEAVDGVRWRLKDDNGKMGETTVAVLAVIEQAIQYEREQFEESIAVEARIERIQAAKG